MNSTTRMSPTKAAVVPFLMSSGPSVAPTVRSS